MNQIDDFVLEEQQGQTTFITWTGMTREKISISHPPTMTGASPSANAARAAIRHWRTTTRPWGRHPSSQPPPPSPSRPGRRGATARGIPAGEEPPREEAALPPPSTEQA